MYHQHQLDSPPPRSQFRRPWSPEPFDPNPPTEPYRPLHETRAIFPQTRREPSDTSVEVLDLADYAATFSKDNQYPDFPPPTSYHSGDRPTSRSQRHHSVPLPSDAGIDTSSFPLWSRHWYDQPSRLPPSNDYDDIYTSPPRRTSRNIFDPSHTLQSPSFGASSPPPPFSSSAHDSGILPWSWDNSNNPIDSGTKEERIRMLEREFAGAHPTDDRPEVLIGSADANGNLITQGPRKRIIFRITQILLTLAAAVPGIYAALAIKTTVTPTPSRTPAAYVLYVASCVTFLGLFFYFAIHPCFRKRVKAEQQGIPGLAGMVLPGGGGKKKKKGKKGYPQQQDVHVNLIVDPSMFRPSQEDEDNEWEGSTAVGSNPSGKKRDGPKRKNIMTSLMEERLWLTARARAKKILCLDILLSIVWTAIFIYIMLGKRCAARLDEPSSSSSNDGTASSLDERAITLVSSLVSRAYTLLTGRAPEEKDNGVSAWCTAWNVSSAAACLLALVSGVLCFFGVKDLGGSRVNPRKR